MGKTIIHEFNPQIYPVRLWVTITSDLDELSERFEYYPSGDKLETIEPERMSAFTYYVRKKETGHMGTLIAFRRKGYCDVKNIAHEATHAARYIWNHIGEHSPATEADAYLVGWIAECVEEVKLNK